MHCQMYYSNRCFTVVQPRDLLLSLTIKYWKGRVGSAFAASVKTCYVLQGWSNRLQRE